MATRARIEPDEVAAWIRARPSLSRGRGVAPGDLDRDARALSAWLLAGDALWRRLPSRPRRSPDEAATVAAVLDAQREARTRFARAHAGRIYRDLTADLARFVRLEDLVYRVADRVPGLVPTRAEVEAERRSLQKDKDGVEIDQGILVSHLLADREAGLHLVHAMLRPTSRALELLPEFQARGALDLGPTRVERQGKAGHVIHGNPAYLNAEDDAVVPALETAVDLVLLDPACEVGVLRGAVVDHPKYAGRRVFNAGINLTHIYHGQVSVVGFYLVRDLGYVNKLYRGLSGPEFLPDEPELTTEKPWIAAVETFAIGGGCQILLAVDRVLAERGAYFNLPARKEGIIPGAANLRLTRFVGDRLARQGILHERVFAADSPEGRLICDEVVEPGGMDQAIARAVEGLTGAGVVSAAANRRALREDQEPLDAFRRYMATYAREQAYCHHSPALIANLERHWHAAARSLKPAT